MRKAFALAILLCSFSYTFSQTILTKYPQANGVVSAMARKGDTVFMGGNFTKVGTIGQFGVPLDANGKLPAGFPQPNGTVSVCISDKAGGWYIGGTFTFVGTVPRTNLAHITSTGIVDPLFQGYAFNGSVTSLFLSGNRLYVGGAFTGIGTNTGRAALVNATTGEVSATFPNINGTINAMISDGSGGWYVGGTFTLVGSNRRTNIARINSDGSVNEWSPNANATITALHLSGNTLYVGGSFTSIGGVARNRIAAFNVSTGVVTGWNPNANSTVSAIVASGSYVFMGGSFTTIGGVAKQYLAAIDPSTGVANAWNPLPSSSISALAAKGDTLYVGGSFTNFNTTPVRNYLASFRISTFAITAWDPSANSIVRSIVINGNDMYVGGNFTSVAATARGGAAAFTLSSAANPALTSWNPNTNAAVFSIAVSGSRVFLGGTFTTVGGILRNRFVSVATGTATVDSLKPSFNNTVNILAVSGNTIGMGGTFNGLASISRNFLLSLDAGSGALTNWNPSPNTNVSAINVSGNTVYIGGSFTNVGGLTRNRLAAIDATTGIATSWDPNMNNNVTGLAVTGTSVYAVGGFTTVGAALTPRNYIAEINPSTGAVTTWNPSANSTINTILIYNNLAYVGGTFTNVGGQARNRIAALNLSTGLATSWDPNVNNTVTTIQVANGLVYFGGTFTAVGSTLTSRLRVAAVDINTGVLNSFDPQPASAVNSIATYNNTIYVGGAFSRIGGESRNRLAAFDVNTGALFSWNPNANSTVSAIAVSNNAIYVGGAFTIVGGQTRLRIAAIDPFTGLAIASFNPTANSTVSTLAVSGSTVYAGGVFSTIGGQTRSRIAALDASTGLATSWNPNANSTVSTSAIKGDTLFVGGSFNSIGGSTRPYVAAFRISTGALTAINPTANSTVTTMVIKGDTLFMGGTFSTVAGVSRVRIAAYNISSNTINSWYPVGGALNTVNTLSLSGNYIVAGGTFTSIGGITRNRVGLIDATTGVVTSWDANANSTVSSTFANANNVIFLGGSFSTIQALAFPNFVALNNCTSSVDPTLSYTAPVCLNGNLQLKANTIAGATYTWYGPNGFTSSLQNPLITNVTQVNSGDYYCYTTINNCVSNAVSLHIDVAAASVTASSNNACAGQTLELYAGADPGATFLWSGPNGFSSTLQNPVIANAQPVNAGVYTVTATVAGCSAVANATSVTLKAPAPVITPESPIAICAGSSVTLDAGFGYSSYNWSTGAVTRTITVSSAGSYTVSGVVSGCISESDTVIVQTVSPISISQQPAAQSVCTGANVTLSVTAANVIGYQWFQNGLPLEESGNYSGVNTPTLTMTGVDAANAGNFYCLLTSATCANVNTNTVAVTVTSLTQITTQPALSVAVCTGTNATLTVAATGTSLTYQWYKDGVALTNDGHFSGVTTNTLTILNATNADESNGYYCIISSPSSCSPQVSTVYSAVLMNEIPLITALTNLSLCSGVSLDIPAISTGENLNYQWRKGTTNLTDGTVISGTNLSTLTFTNITTAEAGSYNVVVTNSCGTTTSNSFNITVTQSPTVTVSGTQTICEGNAVTLTASGATNYTWNPGALTGASVSVSPTFTTEYSVTGSNGTCSQTKFVTVNVTPKPDMPDVAGATSICTGSTATLLASGDDAGTFSWYSAAVNGTLLGSGTSFTTPALTSPATYYVQQNLNGCSSDRTAVTINIYPLATASITAGGPATFCNGGSVTLTANPGSFYQWSTGEVTQSITATAGGSYSVTVTNEGGCSATSAATVVTVNPSPVATISAGGPTTFCQGGSVTLTASAGSSYLWSNGATTQSISVSAGGNYSVTVTNANGCSTTSATTTVTVNPLPASTITTSGATTFCQGGNVVLTASAGTSYLWSTGATTPSITVSTGGNYSVTVTNSNGCSSTSAVTTVTVNALPTAVITADGATSLCAGNSVALIASNGSSYLWSTGETTSQISASSAGSYTVTVTDANGCSTTSAATTITVTALPTSITPSVSPSSICGSGAAGVTLPSSQPGVSYTLRNNTTNAVVAGPVTGTGAAINFNTGTISSTTTYNVLAQTANSGALTFDGVDDYVAVPHSSNLNVSAGGQLTMEAWVFPTSANVWRNIMMKGTYGYGMAIDASNRLYYWDQAGGNANNTWSDVTVPSNQWSHVAIVVQDNGTTQSVKLYLNGVNVGNKTSPVAQINDNTNNLIIGMQGTGCACNRFAGRMDELRVWNVTRTAAEINASMNSCLSGSENGLIAYYTFDNGSGTVLTDTKSANNGTLTNFNTASAWTTGNVSCGASCSQQMANTVTVTVNPLATASITADGPTTICAGNTVTLTANSGAAYLWSNGATTQSITVGTAGNYSVTVTNAGGCSAISAATTVAVNTAPVITCPANITVNAASGSCAATVTYPAATVSGSPAPAVTYSIASGSSFNVGVTTVTATATNTCGTTSCTFTVTVIDNIAPVITCPANISVNASSASGAVVNYTTPVGTDNCAGVTTTRIAGLASGVVFPIGTTTVTYTATDASNNSTQCSFTVTVSGLAPVISCPANITVNNTAGQCGANVTFAAIETTAVPASTITYSIAPGSFFAVGTTTVTATATNTVGTSTCSFTVTVVDNQPPVVVTKPVTVYLNAQGTASITAADVNNGTTDNCGSVTLSVSSSTFNCSNVGANTVTLTAKDNGGAPSPAGLLGHWKFEPGSEFIDLTGNWQPMQVFNGASVTGGYLDVNAGQFGRVQGYTGPAITSKTLISWLSLDNLTVTAGSGITIDRINSDHFDGVVYAERQSNRWMSGSSGFSRTQDFSPGFAETTINTPVMVAITYESLGGGNVRITLYRNGLAYGSYTTANIGSWSAGDAEIWFGIRHGAGTSGPGQLDAKIYEAQLYGRSLTPAEILSLYNSNGSGNTNTATASAVVTVVDTIAPVLTCPSNIAVNAATGLCQATVNIVAPAATDNCSATVSGTRSDNLSLTAPYPVGTTTITWTATDPSGNVSNTCIQTVTVTDNQKPVITTSGNTNVNADAGVCSALVSVSATAIDNCSVGTPTGVRSDNQSLSAPYPVGTTTITWNVTDVNGNAAVAVTQTVTVTDNQIPVITHNGDKSVNAEDGVCSAVVTVSATATDNCGVGTPTGVRSDNQPLTAPYLVGTTTITWNVTDVNGNAAVAITQTVTVTDNQIPVITHNGDKNVNAEDGVCSASVTVSATATDNCGVGSPTGVRSDNQPLTAPYPVGTTTITWNVTDVNGNAAVAVTQTVTVTDNQIPVITHNGDKNVSAENGVCSAVVTVSATATDNCGVGTPSGVRSDNQPLTAPYPVGTTTITWNVIDINGNAAVAVMQTVTVTDNQIPVITHNGDKNVNAEDGVCSASVTVSATATDNCGVGSPTGVRSDNQPLTALYPVGTTTITWNVTDVNGNAAVAVTQTVTVTDNQIPVITHNGDKSVNAENGVCSASVTVSATAIDNCGVGTPAGVRSDNQPLTAPYPVGTTTITWNVTDVNGNAAVAVTQTVTVADNQVPVITHNGDKTVSAENGVCSAAVTVSATAIDNCGVGSPTGVRSDNQSLSAPYPVGTTTITWNVTDVNGNAAVAVTQTVTVTDNQIPVITHNGDKSVNAEDGVCSASVTVSATATDNCGVGSPTGVRSDNQSLSAPYPVGTTTITWNVTDVNGNAAVAVTQTVTVTDNQIPVITHNGDKSVNAEDGVCSATVIVSATATDNCGVGSPTGVRSDNQPLTAPYLVGTTTITWNVTDINGNTAVAVTQTVTVTDNQIPVITHNGDKSVNAEDGVCSATVIVSATATDNCGVGSPTGVRSDNQPLTAPYPVGTTTITWNVTDINGNTAVAVTQTVTVTDNQIPVITHNGDKSVNAEDGVCSATVIVSATATDNCGVGSPTGVRSDNQPLTAPYPVGTTTITWNVTDINGNAAVAVTQTVTVTDNQIPVITTNGNRSVVADAGVCSAVVSVSAGATDNCSVGTPTGVRSDNQPLTAPYPVGTTTITWDVTDVNGNVATTVTQTVTVTDNQKPVITTNGNKSVNADAGVCSAVVAVSASATDNCGVGTPTGVRSDNQALTAPYPVGTTTITWNVTDVNGNAAVAVTQTVTVTDNQKPVITTNGNKSVNADAGVCSAVVAVSASATDNCGVGTPTGVRSDNQALTAPYPVGTTTITWNVTDVNGNAAVAVTQTVTVTDNQKPVITTNGNKSVNADAGVCSAVVAVSASATDNCGVGAPAGVRSDNQPLTAPYPVGTTTITWNVTDVNGNAAVAVTQTVTVTDTQKPVISGLPSNITKNAVLNNCLALVTWPAPTASDNCGIASFSSSDDDYNQMGFTLLPVGVTTITYTATDVNGNVTTGSFTVTVVDNQKPIITGCPANISVSNAAGACNKQVFWNPPTASDNCPGVTMTGSHVPGDVFPVGSTTVSYTATDASGNVTVCSFTVTVTDNEKPVISNCPSNITVNTGAGNTACSQVATWTAPTATDNCGIAASTASHQPGATFSLGNTTVTYTFTDVNGNVSTCSFVVTVVDNTPPVITCAPDITVNAANGVCTAAVTVPSPAVSDNCSTYSGANNGLDLRGTSDYVNIGSPVGAGSSYTKEAWVFASATSCENIMSSNLDPFWITGGRLSAGNNGNYSVITDPASFPANTWVHVAVTYDAANSTMRLYKNGTQVAQSTTAPAYSGGIIAIGHHMFGGCFFNGKVDEVRMWNVARSAADIAANMSTSLSGNEPGLIAYYDCNQGIADGNNIGITTLIDKAPAGGSNNGTLNAFTLNGTISNFTGGAPAIVSAGTGTLINSVNGTSNASGTYAVGTTSVTWTATDASGNQSTCIQRITVIDNQPPTITCPGNINAIATSASGAVVNYTTPVGTDNCSGSVTVRTAGLASGSTFPIGTTLVTYRVTDAAGLTAQCSFTVTVVGVPPQITCPSNITVNNTTGACGTNVSFAATESAAIPASTISYSHAPGSFFPVGTTTVTATATNPVGTSVCTFTITVNDTEAPKLVGVPSNSTVVCTAVPAAAVVTATDNCPDLGAVQYSEVKTNGNCPGNYTLTRTWSVTDAHGNSTSATQVITVEDTEAPTITTVASDVTVECDGSGNTAALQQWLDTHGGAVASDDCSNVVWTHNFSSLSDDCGATGSATVTFTATDLCGNSSSTTATFKIEDTTAPTITTVASDQTVECDGNGNSSAFQLWLDTHGGSVAGDVCGGVSWTNNFTGNWVAGCGNSKQVTVVFTATDACGNSSTTTATFKIEDTTAPALSVPADVTVNCQDDNSSAATGVATATDACSGATVTQSQSSTQSADVNSAAHYNYVITRTWTAVDACGNSSSAVQTITVRDITAPVITCPQHVTVNCQDDNSSTATGVASATDNCSPVSITQSQSSTQSADVNSAGYYNYVITRTWRATDVTGNYSECVQTITVQDITQPVITCPQSVTINCQDATTPAANGSATGTDNCSPVAITYSDASTQNPNPATAGYYNYVITRTWRATDVTGNYSECVQTITVQDITKPVITCPGNITQCNDLQGNNQTLVLQYSDNCGVKSVSYSITGATVRSGNTADASGSFNVGTSVISWTVTDYSGNSSTCSTTVVINPLPVASISSTDANSYCNGVTLTGSSTLSGPFTYQWMFGGSQVSASQVITLGNSSASGVYTLFVTDGNGCKSPVAASYTYNKENTLGNYTIVGLKKVKLGESNTVQTGSVGVTSGNGYAGFKKNSAVASSGAFVKAADIAVQLPVNIPTQIESPAVVTLPAMQTYTGSYPSNSYTVNQNTTVTLSGNYGYLYIRKGANVTLTGSTFRTLKLEEGATVSFTATTLNMETFYVGAGLNTGTATVKFANGTSVRVSKQVKIEERSIVNPDNSKATFFLGDNNCDEEKFMVKGDGARVTANVYVPNGAIMVQSDCGHGYGCEHDYGWWNHGNSYNSQTCNTTFMTGLFIAEEVESGKNVTWNNNNCSGTLSTTDNVPPQISCPAASQVCQSTSGSYSVTAATASDNSGVVTVSYSTSGATVRSGTGSDASGSFNVGVTTIKWTAKDGNGNVSTCTSTVTVNAAPVVTVSDNSSDPLCSELTLTASGSNLVSYQWKLGNSIISTSQSISLYANSAEGTYTVTATDNKGCSSAPVSYNYSLQNRLYRYTIVGIEKVKLGESNTVQTGSVGVLDEDGEADFKKNSSVAGPGAFVKAADIDVQSPVNIPNKIYAPATVSLPPMQVYTGTYNTTDYTVAQNVTLTLSGNFRTLNISKGANVTLSGTTFRKINIAEGARVTFTATQLNMEELIVGKGPSNGYTIVKFAEGTSVRISRQVKVDENCQLNTEGRRVVFYLGDTRCDEEKFMVMGNRTTVTAIVYVPNGTIKVTGGNLNQCYMNGIFIAEEVKSEGKNVTWNGYNCSYARGTEPTPAETTPVAAAGPVSLKAYPNPTTGVFNLKLENYREGRAEVQVVDNFGKLVARQVITILNSTEYATIDIAKHAAGVYQVRVVTDEGVKTVQVVVAR